MSKLLVGIDLDGVLRDIITPCCTIYNREHGTEVKASDVKTWELNPAMPKIGNNKEFFIKHAKEIFQGGPTIPQTIDLCEKIKGAGHDVAIVTHQYPGIENYSCDWLQTNKVPYDSLHFIRDKQKVKTDILIDDGVHNLLNAVIYGQRPICMDQPWNQDWRGHRMFDTNTFMGYLK